MTNLTVLSKYIKNNQENNKKTPIFNMNGDVGMVCNQVASYIISYQLYLDT